jgi:TonB family protein
VISEQSLRKRVYKGELVMPEYPKAALSKGLEGTVVVEVKVYGKEQGRVVGVKPLESPNTLFTKAVVKAVSETLFLPKTFNGEPSPYYGKLTFYFRIKDGKGVVENPKEFSQNKD